MKKLLSVLLICAMLLSMFLLVGCDETEGPENDPEETATDPDMPEGATPVESIAGKSPLVILDSFTSTFSRADCLHVSGVEKITEDGETETEYIDVMLNGEELYASIRSTGFVQEFCFVDGMLYMNNDGEKMKMSAASAASILGEDFVDELKAEISPEFSDLFLQKVGHAKIYLLNEVYILTAHFTDAEAKEIDPDDGKAYTAKLYFDDQGALIKVENISEGEYIALEIVSYGKPVDITPPADADAYAKLGNAEALIPEGATPVATVNGMTPRQILDNFLAKYTSSKVFDIDITVQQVAEGTVATVREIVKISGTSVYVLLEMDGEEIEICVVDGVAYVNAGGEKIKAGNTEVEDILGDGALEEMLTSILKDMPQFYYTLVDEAQLYFYENTCFFMISLDLSLVGGEGMFTEIFFVDQYGDVIRIVDQTDGMYMDSIINAYGDKPVVITPPADADKYVWAS